MRTCLGYLFVLLITLGACGREPSETNSSTRSLIQQPSVSPPSLVDTCEQPVCNAAPERVVSLDSEHTLNKVLMAGSRDGERAQPRFAYHETDRSGRWDGLLIRGVTYRCDGAWRDTLIEAQWQMSSDDQGLFLHGVDVAADDDLLTFNSSIFAYYQSLWASRRRDGFDYGFDGASPDEPRASFIDWAAGPDHSARAALRVWDFASSKYARKEYWVDGATRHVFTIPDGGIFGLVRSANHVQSIRAARSSDGTTTEYVLYDRVRDRSRHILSQAKVGSSEFRAARDSQGKLHLIFQNESGKLVSATRRGLTWSYEIIGLGDSALQLIVDPAGASHVLLKSQQRLHYATNRSGTWVTYDITEKTGITSASSRGVRIDDQGRVHAVWSEGNDAYYQMVCF